VHFQDFARGWIARPLLIVAASLIASGCSESPVKLYPVTGKVLFKGQPAEGAQVVFQAANEPSDEGPKPPKAFGTVGADGSYALYTDPYGEGAPPGEYAVLVTWFAASPRKPDETINKLPAKYSDHEAPLLKATVKEGKNELEPFQLKP
jgi:hypothetical protein